MISAGSVLKKRDVEQTGCLSRENQESTFTIRKILREQQRGKHTHTKVNIASCFSPYMPHTGKCESTVNKIIDKKQGKEV